MGNNKMPLDWLTLKINLAVWELLPKKKGAISLWNRKYRSLDVQMYFLCFELHFTFKIDKSKKNYNCEQ